MSRRNDTLKVAAAVGACAVCCPPLVVVPLGLLGGLAGTATATTAVLGAPLWLVVALLLTTTTAVAVALRRTVRKRGSLLRRGPWDGAPSPQHTVPGGRTALSLTCHVSAPHSPRERPVPEASTYSDETQAGS